MSELQRRTPVEADSPPVSVAGTRRLVARTRCSAQIVLGTLFILGILGMLYWGRSALPPFLLGLIVAYMLLPLVRRLERGLPSHGRWHAIRRPLDSVPSGSSSSCNSWRDGFWPRASGAAPSSSPLGHHPGPRPRRGHRRPARRNSGVAHGGAPARHRLLHLAPGRRLVAN